VVIRHHPKRQNGACVLQQASAQWRRPSSPGTLQATSGPDWDRVNKSGQSLPFAISQMCTLVNRGFVASGSHPVTSHQPPTITKTTSPVPMIVKTVLAFMVPSFPSFLPFIPSLHSFPSFLPFIPSRNFHQNDPRMNRRKWVSCDCDWPSSTQTRPTESSPKTSLASSFLVHCCTATAIKTALAISTAIVQRITPSVSVEKSHFILSILGRKSLIGRKCLP